VCSFFLSTSSTLFYNNLLPVYSYGTLQRFSIFNYVSANDQYCTGTRCLFCSYSSLTLGVDPPCSPPLIRLGELLLPITKNVRRLRCSHYLCFNGAYSTPAELSSLSSDFPLIASADDYTWHLNGTGSGVDPASADWDITEGMVKMRINGDNIHAKMRTPSKIKSTGAAHETSPLETGSDASADSSSPPDQHLGLPSHSRVSSSDTTFSSHGSRTLHASQYSVDMVSRKLFLFFCFLTIITLPQDGEHWAGREQPSYPSLSARDHDFQVDYNAQQRQFNNAQSSTLFSTGRASNGGPNVQYRQPQPTRAFNHQVQNPVPNPQSFPYTSSHLSVGNTQQLYDMMMPNGQDPSMGRVQQQAFRGGHQHSASDPASLRDAAALQQLLVNNLQPYGGPGMYPPTAIAQPALSLFANQFYGTESYPTADLAAAQLMAARLQSQYQGPFSVSTGPNAGAGMSPTTAAAAAAAALAVANGNGPSANNRKLGLYKTELCRSWEEKGTCRYGNKCQFAHGEDELRKVPRHPKVRSCSA
jgi:Zinc finger C-x8-C-x5-C-x3-H type (and similar)